LRVNRPPFQNWKEHSYWRRILALDFWAAMWKLWVLNRDLAHLWGCRLFFSVIRGSIVLYWFLVSLSKANCYYWYRAVFLILSICPILVALCTFSSESAKSESIYPILTHFLLDQPCLYSYWRSFPLDF
jgi:hypothetical protein